MSIIHHLSLTKKDTEYERIKSRDKNRRERERERRGEEEREYERVRQKNEVPRIGFLFELPEENTLINQLLFFLRKNNFIDMMKNESVGESLMNRLTENNSRYSIQCRN